MLTKESIKLARRTTIILITILLFALLVSGFWYLRNLVFVIIIAYLLTLALQKPIKIIVKLTRLPKGGAVTLTYLLLLALIVFIMSWILPSLIDELMIFLKELNIEVFAPGLAKDLNMLNLTLNELGELFDKFSSPVNTIFNFVGSTFNTLIMAVTLFVLSIHFSLEHSNFYKKIYWITNDEKKVVRVQKFFLVLEKELGGWIVGQSFLMLIMGVLSFIGLFLIGVPYALPLAILTGLLEIIPNLGPTIAAIPAIALAFLYGGPITGVVTVIFCIIIQELENVFIVPQVMKNAAHISPIISIISIIAGYQVFGIMGALLAIPIYMCLRAGYSFWFKQKIITYEKEIFH